MINREYIQYSERDWSVFLIGLINEHRADKDAITISDVNVPLTGRQIGISGNNLYDLYQYICSELNCKIILTEYDDFLTISNICKVIMRSINSDKTQNNIEKTWNLKNSVDQ